MNVTQDDLIQEELLHKIEESLKTKDWTRLEAWAKQWIQLSPRSVGGFKWLARASIAQNNTARAAYAYSRVLDFENQNAEALKFFQDYPSSVPANSSGAIENPAQKPEYKNEKLRLSPEQRKTLSVAEFELAKKYEEFSYFAEASSHYLRSYEWQPNQAAGLSGARSMHRAHKSYEAIQFLRRELGTYHDWIEGRILLGRILFEVGSKTDAQREFQTILRAHPNHKEALNFIRGLYTTYL